MIGFGQTAFIYGNDTICDGDSAAVIVVFTGSSPFTFFYTVNSTTSVNTSYTNTYVIYTSQLGVYTLNIVVDANGDTCTVSGSGIVTVWPVPNSNVQAYPQPTSIVNPTISFINGSSGCLGCSWSWDFGDGSSIDSVNWDTQHTYTDTGFFNVTLYLENIYGCSGSSIHSIYIDDTSTVDVNELLGKSEILKTTDLLGRETKGTKNEVLFYIYDDGTVEKRIVIE